MSDNKRGISFSDIDSNWKLALDPDNVFWSTLEKQSDSQFVLPHDLLNLYNEKRDQLDKELHDFRFGTDLNCVYIDPTDRCNSDCPYCYIPSDLRKTGSQMSGEELDKTLEKIAEYFKNVKKKAVIVFHAAEPLLVKNILFEAIEKYEKQFLFGIQTNALLLEKEDVEFIKKYRVGMGISLDSPESVSNNISRTTGGNKGNFDHAVRAIDWFDGYEGLNVISTVTKYNVNHLPELVTFLHKKRVSCVLLNPVRVTQEKSLEIKADDTLFADKLKEAIETAMELTINSDHQIVIGNFANVILAITSPMARRMMCDISPCGGGRTFLTIAANGDMMPCGEFTGFREFAGGNIFKDSIETAMGSAPFKKVRDRMVEKIEECDICQFKHICGSPCPAEMYARGNIYRKAEFCEFYKEIIKYAFKLIAEDKVRYLLRKDSIDQMEYDYQYESA